MIRSMTGFGRVKSKFKEESWITVEIRTLNSKFLDLNLRYPSAYRSKEPDMRSLAGKLLIRGKGDISINVENTSSEPQSRINRNLVKSYYQELKQISGDLDIKEDIFNIIFRFQDVLSVGDPDVNEEEWKVMYTALEGALVKVNEFRDREGNELENDLRKHISRIQGLLDEIGTLDIERIPIMREKLRSQLDEWVGNDAVDKNRYEEEIVYYIEKMDITEEKVRLKSHCEYFIQILELDELSKGKKLGFLAQEIGREINTIGSKANFATMQRNVVEMKDELEKVKEQVLNVL